LYEIILALLAGFSIARLRPKGANLLFALIFSGTVFPLFTALRPYFIQGLASQTAGE
jgi:ABC-type glycerol-3-phosphate transport system permease component